MCKETSDNKSEYLFTESSKEFDQNGCFSNSKEHQKQHGPQANPEPPGEVVHIKLHCKLHTYMRQEEVRVIGPS